jgi:hypothetical protein
VLDKLLARLDGVMDAVEKMRDRVDALEADRADAKRKHKAHKDDDDTTKDDHHHDDDDPKSFHEQPTQGDDEPVVGPEDLLAKKTVADASRADDAARRYETDLANAQAKCDSVASLFGLRAPAPLVAEKALDYRRRILRPFQRHSAQFAAVDLWGVRDPKVFSGIEQTIYADATKAAGMPEAMVGQLRPRIRRTDSGHTEITWSGDPRVWMSPFAGATRRYVTRINTKVD